MGYNLVIDQGNSAAKVDLFKGDEFVAHYRYDLLDSHHIEELAERYDIDAAIYCSVSHHGEDVIVALRRITDRVYELTSMLPLPFSVGYVTPATLGRDRIAAVAGAYTMYPGRDVLVIDAGTAVTYDLLTAEGCYVGGNIAPGLWMRAKSLHDFTERLPMVDVESELPVEMWGTSTDGAIRAGVVRGVVAEAAYYRSQLGDDAVVIMTGGDAARIAPLIDLDVEVVPELVTKGLNSILLYNEHR